MQPSDRTQDPLRHLYQPMVARYDDYMHSVYEPNIEDRQDAYTKHYDCMKDRLARWLEESVMDGDLPRPERTNFAFVGLMDAGNELDQSILSRLERMRSILLIDFSTRILRRAAESLMQAGVPGQKIHYMQFDITDGLSVTLDEWMREQLALCGEGEDEFHCFFEKLESRMSQGLIIEELEHRFEAKRVASLGGAMHAGNDFLSGGENTDRKLQLNIDGRDYPVDGVSYQMVNAAAFVPTKEMVLERFQEEVQRSGVKSSDAAQVIRKRTLERIYRFFAVASTHSTKNNVTQIIDDNQGRTRVHILTDKSTLWKRPKWGEMPQLNIDGPQGLKEAFHASGKELVETSQVWYWNDLYKPYDDQDASAPILDFQEHGHECQAVTVFQNGKDTVGSSTVSNHRETLSSATV